MENLKRLYRSVKVRVGIVMLLLDAIGRVLTAMDVWRIAAEHKPWLKFLVSWLDPLILAVGLVLIAWAIRDLKKQSGIPITFTDRPGDQIPLILRGKTLQEIAAEMTLRWGLKTPPVAQWPRVLLECTSNPASPLSTDHFKKYVDTRLLLKNQGADAFNVQILPLSSGKQEARFELVPELLKDATKEITPNVAKEREGVNPFYHHDLSDLFGNDWLDDLEEKGMPLLIRYDDVLGRKYETEYSLKFDGFFGKFTPLFVRVRFRGHPK